MSKENKGFGKFWDTLLKSSYLTEAEMEIRKDDWTEWFTQYADYLAIENTDENEREAKMRATNPKYVLRNYMAQLAIDEAEKGDYKLVDELYQLGCLCLLTKLEALDPPNASKLLS